METCSFKHLQDKDRYIIFINSTVRVVNSSVTNSTITKDSAFLVVYRSNINVFNMKVFYNTVSPGSTIVVLYDNSTLTMSYCEFIHNKMSSASIVCSYSSQVLVDSTILRANHADFLVYGWTSDVVINNSEFISNIGSGSTRGRTYVIFGNLSVQNTKFRNNYSYGSSVFACYDSTLQVQNVTLSENGEGAFKLENCLAHVDSTSVVNGTSIEDFATFAVRETNLTITSSVISYNTAEHTNKLLKSAVVNISGCNFSHNFAEKFGAVIFVEYTEIYGNNYYKSTIHVSFTIFENNSASDKGGVFQSNPDQIATFTDCVFNYNSAVSGGVGYIETSKVVYDGCVFQNNIAKGGGGVLSVTKAGMVAMNNCTLSNNSAGEDAGAIFLNLSQ